MPEWVEDGQRIAKVLARAGVCSRRDAERLIADGRVIVDGHKLDTPAFKVGPNADIRVDGKPIPGFQPSRLWRFHKTTGLVTTHKDPEGRPTVFDAVPRSLPRMISVGRLDIDSEGLLLLTNDGDLARHLELPSTGWTRRYRVRVFGKVADEDLEPLARGTEIDGVRYGPIQAKIERTGNTNAWLSVSLKEGKNREVRRVMEHIGLKVSRLIRVSYGPFQLGKLSPGEIDEVPRSVLAEQVGDVLKKKRA